MKWLIIFLVGTGSVFAQQTRPGETKWSFPNLDSIYKGTAYVPFKATLLNGTEVTNETCKGKVTFIDFWFETCRGCREEIGALNELYDSIRNNPSYQFISITFDSPDILPEFIKKMGIRYPVATVASQSEAHRLNYHQGFPSKVILDKQGKIAYIGMAAIGPRDEGFNVSMKRILSIMRSCGK